MSSPDLHEYDDATLLRAHIEGDPDAFGVLFARHRDRLWAVALRTMGNPHDAADGLQDAMVAAFRRAATFRGDAAVSTWLHRIVVNACLDRIRAAKVRRAEALPDDLADHPSHTLVSASGDPNTDPEAAALSQEQRTQVLAALAQLPPEQRAALVLVDLEGHSVAHAAVILECAEGTVKSRCSRGRSRLAVLLAPLRSEFESTSGNPPPPPDVPPKPKQEVP